MSWKVSEPHTSHVYALTWRRGLTSDTRVTIPRTVINLPRNAPFTSLTAIGISLVKGLKYRLLRHDERKFELKEVLLTIAEANDLESRLVQAAGHHCAPVSDEV